MYNVLFLLFNIRLILSAGEITPKSHTVLYGSTGWVSCKANTVDAVTWSWKRGEVPITSGEDGLTIVNGEESEKKSVLTVNNVRETATYTCEMTAGSNSPVTMETKLHVASIAGVSSPLCRSKCQVSCVLSDLEKGVNEPGNTYWTVKDGDTNHTITDTTQVNLSFGSVQHNLSDFRYTSQETVLTITDLTATSRFTCVYEFSDNTIEYVVSALLRPMVPCDVFPCTTQALCHSNEVNSNDTCRDQCKECYSYHYVEGEFLHSGQCGLDSAWCMTYLNHRKNCNQNPAKRDRIVEYCDLCGYCLDLEFRPSKMVLPIIFIVALVLLIILMCYKAYDEKRKNLPKVKTKASRSNGMETKQSSQTV